MFAIATEFNVISTHTIWDKEKFSSYLFVFEYERTFLKEEFRLKKSYFEQNIWWYLTVNAPIPKARISVILVTVTDTPACSIVNPILSGIESCAFFFSFAWLYQHAMITNMSSMPMPAKMKNIISL